MCTTRNWKNLVVSKGNTVVFATRSDNVIFNFSKERYNSIIEFVKDLESYRNCECTQVIICDMHLDNKEK